MRKWLKEWWGFLVGMAAGGVAIAAFAVAVIHRAEVDARPENCRPSACSPGVFDCMCLHPWHTMTREGDAILCECPEVEP